MGSHHHHNEECGDHAHGHGHHHHHAHGSLDRLKIALILNLSFTIIELVGGYWTNSVAIFADAFHDFGDTLILAGAFFLERQSRLGPTAKYSYGFGRLSLLSAVLSGCFLVAGSVFIATESLQRLTGETQLPHTTGMMALALLGLLVNGWAARSLWHGHSHNEKMLSWHLLEDFLGWAAVLVGAIFMYFKGWAWVDPFLAIGISAVVVWNAIRNLWHSGVVLMQATPMKSGEIKKQMAQVKGVREVHDLHVWSLDGARHVLTLHAVIVADADHSTIKKEIRAIARRFGGVHTTIELETETEVCEEACD